VTRVAASELAPLPGLAVDAHKGDAGRVLSCCGSRTMPGAAVLAARAAQRAGAGLVVACCLDPELLAILPVGAPEAVLVDGAGSLAESVRADARLAGPGLGATERTRELVSKLLRDASSPLALDADALNVLDGEPERLADTGAPLVLTPHPGEAARLLGRDVPRDAEGRLAAARELAERAGVIVCLKGHATVVTDGARDYVNDTGNPGMATAGSGDVLAGMLAAYLATCDDAFTAAAHAVRLHGLAGDLAAAERGERAVIASDLIEHLGRAQRSAEA
jgi:NAD(P)H-hydrate epimerase